MPRSRRFWSNATLPCVHGCRRLVIAESIKKRRPNGAATVMDSPPVLDRQAAATLIAGALLLAISFSSNIGYGALIHLRAAALDEQIGVCLHLAALAALVGDAELATRLRHRARNEEIERRNREDSKIQRAATRRIAVIRFQLADTPFSRLRLNAALAALLEELQSSQENA